MLISTLEPITYLEVYTKDWQKSKEPKKEHNPCSDNDSTNKIEKRKKNTYIETNIKGKHSKMEYGPGAPVE